MPLENMMDALQKIPLLTLILTPGTLTLLYRPNFFSKFKITMIDAKRRQFLTMWYNAF